MSFGETKGSADPAHPDHEALETIVEELSQLAARQKEFEVGLDGKSEDKTLVEGVDSKRIALESLRSAFLSALNKRYFSAEGLRESLQTFLKKPGRPMVDKSGEMRAVRLLEVGTEAREKMETTNIQFALNEVAVTVDRLANGLLQPGASDPAKLRVYEEIAKCLRDFSTDFMNPEIK